jgi:cyclopropane fatty-acyl-phospholipid synthase-like methyltransferase
VKIEGERLLDLGSGYGGRSVEFNPLSGAHVVGIDIFTEATRPALSFARSMGARAAPARVVYSLHRRHTEKARSFGNGPCMKKFELIEF